MITFPSLHNIDINETVTWLNNLENQITRHNRSKHPAQKYLFPSSRSFIISLESMFKAVLAFIRHAGLILSSSPCNQFQWELRKHINTYCNKVSFSVTTIWTRERPMTSCIFHSLTFGITTSWFTQFVNNRRIRMPGSFAYNLICIRQLFSWYLIIVYTVYRVHRSTD